MKEANELHSVDQGVNIFSSELYWLSGLLLSAKKLNGNYLALLSLSQTKASWQCILCRQCGGITTNKFNTTTIINSAFKLRG